MTSTLIEAQRTNNCPEPVITMSYAKSQTIILVFEAYILVADRILSTKSENTSICMKKIANDLSVISLSDSTDIARLEESLKNEVSKHFARKGLGSLISKLVPNLPNSIDAEVDNHSAASIDQARDRLDLVRCYVTSKTSGIYTIRQITQSELAKNIQKLCFVSEEALNEISEQNSHIEYIVSKILDLPELEKLS